MSRLERHFSELWLFMLFGELRAAVDLFEGMLQDEVAALDARVEAETSRMLDEERETFYAFMSDEHDHWLIHESFPNVLRRALFLASYAKIESYMNDVCRAVQTNRNLRCELSDLRGSGIERAKHYLTKVAQVTFPSDAPEWRRLCDYNKLRNVLAHSDARLTEEQKADHLGRYVSGHPSLELHEDGTVIIKPGFCEEVIETAMHFFELLSRDLTSDLSLGEEEDLTLIDHLLAE